MALISFLLRHSKKNAFLAALVGVVSGVSNGVLMAQINHVLSHSGLTTSRDVAGFAGITLLVLITNFLSRYLLIDISEQAAFDMRMRLSRQVLAVPLRQIEEIGGNRIFTTLTEDVPSITRAVLTLPIMFINVAILIGCFIYLGIISWVLLVGLILFLVFGIYSFTLPLKRAGKVLNLARKEADDLIAHFQALTDGMKELKLHRPRREAFLLERLQSTADKLRRYLVVAGTTEAVSNSWGSVLYFIFIGLLLFLFPKFQSLTPADLTAYIITFLYIRAPIASMVESSPVFARAGIAFKTIEKLGVSLSSVSEEPDIKDNSESKASWDCLELVGVKHTYRREGEEHNFALGPINLKVSPRQMIFLMGGNGSGKTTLAKLITGLYAPEEGEVWFGGRSVTDKNREDYRQHFSAVFSEFHLFELLGLNGDHLNERARDYLAKLSLDHKVEVKAGELSTVKLSQGQRKRLALLTAYLEDRPIYVFDEWAADQDPAFKDIFYLKLLPELKANGKTIIVITHDDRYCHMADRIVKLENGVIEYDKQVSKHFAGV